VKNLFELRMESFTEILNNDNSMILAISTQALLENNGLGMNFNSYY